MLPLFTPHYTPLPQWHTWVMGSPGPLDLPEAAEAVEEAGAFIRKFIPHGVHAS